MSKRRGSPNPTPAVKKAVIERDGFSCVLNLPGCTGNGEVTDHRANRQAGGSRVLNHPAVLISACVPCNGAKEDSTGEQRAELIRRGLIVLPAATHEKTLARALQTLVEFPDGSVWRLVDEHTRIRADL